MKHFCLIGYPLGHSISDKVHNYLYETNNLDAKYELKETKEEDLGNVINDIRNGIINGCSVTIPYKEKIIPYLDSLTDAAKEIGAVNTIYVKDFKVIGDNTDYYGFIKTLELFNVDVKGKRVFVLGSGGASKACQYAVKQLGAKEIIVVSRQGKYNYDSLEKEQSIDVLINATPVGMWPNVDDSPVKKEIIDKTKSVVDVIYNPSQTKFLQFANSMNNGMPMLFYQAVKANNIWFNQGITFDIFDLIKRFGVK